MRKAIVMVLVIFLSLSFLAYSQESNEIKLKLEDAIVDALKNNLDIQVEVINPSLFLEALKRSNALFIPQFTLSGNKLQSTSPASNAIVGAAIDTSDTFRLNSGLSQRLATGGTLQFSVNNTRTKSSSQFSTFNPSFSSSLSFSLAQPMLKNVGTFITKRGITLAVINQQKSVYALKLAVINMIYSVEAAYWNLVYAYQNVDVKRKSLQLAQDLLKQNETQVRVGVSAPMDILTAKAEVAARESDLIQAESLIQSNEEDLRKILNKDTKYKIMPVEAPAYGGDVTVDMNQFMLEALDKRPDIEQVRIDLKAKNIDVRYYRNQLLPDLQLTATYSTSGLSGDQIIFDGNPLFGKIKEVIKGGLSESLKDVLSNLYRNYSVGLSLSVPLSNDAARSDLASAQLNLKSALLNLKRTEANIYSEVKQVVIDVETNKKILAASRVARELAEEKLNAEQKKLSVGLTTNYQVLQFQRDYSTALITELRSIIDYNLTLSRISRVLGRTLEKHNINFNEFLK